MAVSGLGYRKAIDGNGRAISVHCSIKWMEAISPSRVSISSAQGLLSSYTRLVHVFPEKLVGTVGVTDLLRMAKITSGSSFKPNVKLRCFKDSRC